MPKKPAKPPHEMTSEELAKKVFPARVLEQLKKIANPQPSPPKGK